MDIPLRQYWHLLARHIRPQMSHFWLLSGLLLGSIGLQIVNPQIVAGFLDAARSGADTQRLVMVSLAFLGMALLQQVVSVGATYVGENVAWRATNQLRSDLAWHCLHLDMGFFSDTSPGELIERIDGDVSQLSSFFSQFVIRVVGNIVLILGVLVALLLADWRLGSVFGAAAVVALAALTQVRSVAVPFQKALRQSAAELYGFLEERLAGTEDIRSSGAVDFVLRELYEHSYHIARNLMDTRMRFLLVRLVGGLLLLFGTAAAMGVSYALVSAGAITLGTAYLAVQYTIMLRRPIRDLTQLTENLQNIGAATDRLLELRRVRSAIQNGPGATIPPDPIAIEFDGVSFSYVDDEPVLDQVSFGVAPGEVLGLLGRTGSGKTTIARLIFRLYDPAAGQVLLNGIDTRTPKIKALRQRVALVTQEVHLFAATVRDNLTFFDRTISDERIHAALEGLELTDWYHSLPDGLDTRLESDGRGLSAGEAQLLAFTRVFLRDPGLIVLDEASSRLDPATEQRIERALDRLLEGRTVIVIAHRLGTVERADAIAILSEGHVVEHGDRLALARDPGSRFHALLQTGMQEVLA